MEEIPYSVRSAVFGVLKTLAVKASQNKLDLLYKIDPAIPDFVVGDPFRLRQVITNLVGNSVKFTTKGQVALSCRLAGLDEQGNYILEFCVADSGIGIKPDKLTVIFDTFCQADGSTTRKYGGTGLGLTISKRLVNLMGGDLWVKSEYGKGSQFYFTTKARPGPWTTEAVRQRMAVAHPGRRVLYIDTQLGNGVGDAVRACGLEFVHVKSIDEACEQNGLFDTVLVDSLAVLENLREVEKLRYIPLVLISTHIPQLNLKYALDYVSCSFSLSLIFRVCGLRLLVLLTIRMELSGYCKLSGSPNRRPEPGECHHSGTRDE